MFPERHRHKDIQTSDITVDYEGHVLWIRPGLVGVGGELPKVFVVKEFASELPPSRRHPYNVVVARNGTVLKSNIPDYEAGSKPNKLKVAVVDTRSQEYPEGDMGSVNQAFARWASFGVDRPGAEVSLEMRLRADKTRVLLNWGDRRDARVHLKMLGNQASPVLRKCRECGQMVGVEEDGMLMPHLRNFAQEHCIGTGCTCPEDRVIQESNPRKIDVHVDGNCLVHGIHGLKSRRDEQA